MDRLINAQTYAEEKATWTINLVWVVKKFCKYSNLFLRFEYIFLLGAWNEQISTKPQKFNISRRPPGKQPPQLSPKPFPQHVHPFAPFSLVYWEQSQFLGVFWSNCLLCTLLPLKNIQMQLSKWQLACSGGFLIYYPGYK